MVPISAARCLARFVTGVALDDIPAPVAARATALALDTLGNALAASREDFGRAVFAVAERLGGRAESGLLGGGVIVGVNQLLSGGPLTDLLAALAPGDAGDRTGRPGLSTRVTPR